MAKLLIHIGEGDDRKTYTYEREKLLNVESIAIEKATGMAYLEFEHALTKLSMIAVTGLIWVLRKRTEPYLTYDDVQFEYGDLETDFVDDDVKVAEDPKAPEPGSVEDKSPAEPS